MLPTISRRRCVAVFSNVSCARSDSVSRRRWPLHPQPTEWETLRPWVRRIAAAYGVNYTLFLRHALGRTGRGARDLEHAPEETLQRLADGTGVPLERLREMTNAAIMARAMASYAARLETEEGGRQATDPWDQQWAMMRSPVSEEPVPSGTQTQASGVCETKNE